HQPAVRRCGIGPGVFEAAEVCFTLADCGQHIKQVACRACQPVEPGHQQHIARLKPANDLGELGTVSLCARYLFLEHFGCACSHQLCFLRAEILSVSRDSRIAVSCHCPCLLLKAICALYFSTGINARKIIQNLKFVNSFGLSSPAFFVFWFFHFAIWVRCKPVGPRRGEGADGTRSLSLPSILSPSPSFSSALPGSRRWDPLLL